MPGRANPATEVLRERLAHWAELWRLPGLEDSVSIAFSSRLRRTLGRCRPAMGRITLSQDLQDQPPEQLAEVLCHEAAHVAAYRLYGRQTKPHGPEWQRLVAAAGFGPRTRAKAPGPSKDPGPPQEKPMVEHRCPVCQTARFARRAVPTWRCAECLEAGLDGVLVITRHNTGKE